MPTELFTDGIEPQDLDTPILRFMERWKFEDLLTGRMYFRRADLFEDESKGLPLEEYWQTLNLNRLDLNDIHLPYRSFRRHDPEQSASRARQPFRRSQVSASPVSSSDLKQLRISRFFVSKVSSQRSVTRGFTSCGLVGKLPN